MVLDRCGTPVYQGCVLLVFVSWAWSTSVSAVLTWTVRLDKTGGLTNPSQVGVGPGNQKLSYQDETTLMNPKNHLNSPASAAWPAQDFPIPVVPTWPGCCKGNSLHSSKFEDIKVFKVGQKKNAFPTTQKTLGLPVAELRFPVNAAVPTVGEKTTPGSHVPRIAGSEAIIFFLEIELKM